MSGVRIIRDLVIAIILAAVAVFLLVFVRGLKDEPAVDVVDGVVVEEESSDEVFATGVSGRVVVGPQCPIERTDTPCPDAPYDGVVDILVDDPERELIARVRTDAEGFFATALPAGSFIIAVQTNGVFPVCSEEQVVVAENEVTDISVTCDSGIR